MGRAKNRKTNRKKRYGRDGPVDCRWDERGAEEEEEEEQGEASQNHSEVAHQVPPQLAPYALTKSSQISAELRKYWKQRKLLFSFFDGSSPTGMLPLLDEQSWFSVTPEPIAARISHRCNSNVILDAFCGAGGNAIQFAFTCKHVVAIDIDPVKLLLARHNAQVYGVEDRITFLLGDYGDFARDWAQASKIREESDKGADSKWMGCEKWIIDVVFLSPPWGGIEYRQQGSPAKANGTSMSAPAANQPYDYYPLSRLEPNGGREMFELARRITENVCMYLPRTVDLNELVSLVDDGERTQGGTIVDVEEQWLGNRCKAIACYFGELTA